MVRRHFSEPPFSRPDATWPRVSVVVCNYNGGDTLDETLASLEHLDYPNYETILVDDGSTDGSLEIGRRHERHVRLLMHDGHVNRGLSVSRNLGAERIGHAGHENAARGHVSIMGISLERSLHWLPAGRRERRPPGACRSACSRTCEGSRRTRG